MSASRVDCSSCRPRLAAKAKPARLLTCAPSPSPSSSHSPLSFIWLLSALYWQFVHLVLWLINYNFFLLFYFYCINLQLENFRWFSAKRKKKWKENSLSYFHLAAFPFRVGNDIFVTLIFKYFMKSDFDCSAESWKFSSSSSSPSWFGLANLAGWQHVLMAADCSYSIYSGEASNKQVCSMRHAACRIRLPCCHMGQRLCSADACGIFQLPG